LSNLTKGEYENKTELEPLSNLFPRKKAALRRLGSVVFLLPVADWEIRYSGDVTMSFRRACLLRYQLLGRPIRRRPSVVLFDVLL